jgi:hypothetical protein
VRPGAYPRVEHLKGVIYGCKMFYDIASWGQCYKKITAVIYHHSMVIPSFCVIKLYYLGNYHGMAVNYRGILTLKK